MHVIAKSVRSRRPSSRLSSDTFHFLPQLDADAAQALAEELRFAAQPDAEEAFQSEVYARHDQHALVDADPFASS